MTSKQTMRLYREPRYVGQVRPGESVKGNCELPVDVVLR